MLSYNLILNHGNNLVYEALMTEEFVNEYICKCTISVNKNDNSWNISQWYANKNYQHQGYGRATMKYLVNALYNLYGVPNKLVYIWNNANEYVYDWIHLNFDAKISDSTLLVLKYSDEDIKEGHEYFLNIDKFFKYFGIGEEK